MRHTFKLNIFLLITLSFISNIIFCSALNPSTQRTHPSTESNSNIYLGSIKIEVSTEGIASLLTYYQETKLGYKKTAINKIENEKATKQIDIEEAKTKMEDVNYLHPEDTTTKFIKLRQLGQINYQAIFSETWTKHDATTKTEKRSFFLSKENLIELGILQ